jgi:hypothetical protein
VAGLGETKKLLREAVLLPLKFPHLFAGSSTRKYSAKITRHRNLMHDKSRLTAYGRFFYLTVQTTKLFLINLPNYRSVLKAVNTCLLA